MILGIGTDIVLIDRIRSLIETNGDRFINRILSEEEKFKIKNSGQNMDISSYVAKRFAAKEAFAKAIGLGIGRGVNFSDICVANDIRGKPVVNILDKKEFLRGHLGAKDFVIHISISDEDQYAVAYCLIEST